MIKISKKSLNEGRFFVSPKVYLIDTIDSFKFRSTQTLFSLFTTLALFGLGSWGFICEAMIDNWRGSSVLVLSLLYFPLFLSIMLWFRGLSIYDLTSGMKYDSTSGMKYEEEKPRTKKDVRAALSLKISGFGFFLYYCYGVFRLGGIFWCLGIICLAGVLFFLCQPKNSIKEN